MDKKTDLHLRLFEQFKRAYYAFGEIIPDSLDEAAIPQPDILEDIAKNNQCAYIVLDALNLKPLFITSNIEKMAGYPANAIMEVGLAFFFKILHKSHHGLLTDLFKITEYEIRIDKSRANPNYCKHSVCGFKVNTKSGQLKRGLMEIVVTGFGNSGFGSVWIVAVYDITHLFKSDFYWIRSAYDKAGQKKSHYHGKTCELKKRDILTNREKEVLGLIGSGHTTNQIADLLFISPNTVEKHRKNMIARTGAKNTTALVQICQLIGAL